MINNFSSVYDGVDFYNKLTPIPYVLYGELAFIELGVSVTFSSFPYLIVYSEIMKGDITIGRIVSYINDKDFSLAYCTKVEDKNLKTEVYMPTIERAFVDCIRLDMVCMDEGSFCDSLERYQNGGNFDYNLLIEVANYFGITKNTIDYWLEETSDFNSY